MAPQDFADLCEIVFVSPPTLAAFREVAFGAEGLVKSRAMKLLVNTCPERISVLAQMTALRRRMIDDMTVRNLSPATQQSYVYAVAEFDDASSLAGRRVLLTDRGELAPPETRTERRRGGRGKRRLTATFLLSLGGREGGAAPVSAKTFRSLSGEDRLPRSEARMFPERGQRRAAVPFSEWSAPRA